MAYALAVLGILAAGFCALILYNTWREKRTQRQMAREHSWRMWIGQVRARLENLEGPTAPMIIDRDAEWFHRLWSSGFSPNAAVEKWKADRERSFHERFEP